MTKLWAVVALMLLLAGVATGIVWLIKPFGDSYSVTFSLAKDVAGWNFDATDRTTSSVGAQEFLSVYAQRSTQPKSFFQRWLRSRILVLRYVPIQQQPLPTITLSAANVIIVHTNRVSEVVNTTPVLDGVTIHFDFDYVQYPK